MPNLASTVEESLNKFPDQGPEEDNFQNLTSFPVSTDTTSLIFVLIELFSLFWLRRHERISIDNRRFRSNGVDLVYNFRNKGSSRTNHSLCQKSRINVLSYGVRMWVHYSGCVCQNGSTSKWLLRHIVYCMVLPHHTSVS